MRAISHGVRNMVVRFVIDSQAAVLPRKVVSQTAPSENLKLTNHWTCCGRACFISDDPFTSF